MSLTVPYRTILADQGLAQSALYNGDPAIDQSVKILLSAAGQGPVYDEDGPLMEIPGKVVDTTVLQKANTALVSDNGTVAPVASGNTDTAATSDSSASSGLSLKGAVAWAKDNPGKAVAVVIGAALILNEVFKKGKR